jgi:hypothetical protein
MNETFAKLKVQQRRAEEEKEFTEWVNADKKRIEKYGTALENINKAIKERESVLYLYKYLTETIANIEVASVANHYAGVAEAIAKGDTELANKIAKSLVARINNFFINYSSATDRKVAKAMIKVFRDKVRKEDLPSFYNTIDNNFSGNVDAYIDNIFDNTIFTSKEKISNALTSNPNAFVNDPALALGSSIFEMMPKLQFELSKAGAPYAQGNKDYIAGQLEMKKGKAMYPDANSTMRLSYGKILNYSPKDAVLFEHISTLKGVMEKEDPNNWEFVVPQKLKDLYNKKDYGQYAMKNGELPVAFLSNNDITGGNSGSPVMNANGELIGIAFDGNWEAMSGDIIFEPSLQRTISVDIRYVLFIMDKFGGAGYLLNEMSIVK